MLSNFLFIITIVCLAGLIHVTSSPMPGGDRGVGYAFAMFFSGGGFILFSGFLFWSLYSKFPVIGYPIPAKPMIVFFSWLCFAIAVFALAAFRTEWHPGELPQILKTMADARGDIIIPVLVLLPCFLYVNTTQTAGHHPWYTYGFLLPGVGLSFLISVLLLLGWFKANQQYSRQRQQEAITREASLKDNYWKSINEYKAGDPLVYILSFTGRFHDQDIKDAAVAKVKSNPDWEDKLIELLGSAENAPQTYTFIDGNRVDHPEKFIQPLAYSLELIAVEIRSRIKDSNNLQDWHFEHMSLERCLRALDEQFNQNNGQEFVAPLTKVLQALQSPRPERFKDVKFNTEKPVQDWLKRHGG